MKEFFRELFWFITMPTLLLIFGYIAQYSIVLGVMFWCIIMMPMTMAYEERREHDSLH